MLSKLIVACEQGNSSSYVVIDWLLRYTCFYAFMISNPNPLSAKPLSESMLPYCQLDRKEHISMKIC